MEHEKDLIDLETLEYTESDSATVPLIEKWPLLDKCKNCFWRKLVTEENLWEEDI